MSNGNQRGDFRPDERSDLFSVRQFNADGAIAPIEKVPLTREEIRRRRLVRATYVIIAITLVVSGTWLALYLRHIAQVDEAVAQAGSDVRVDSVRAALGLLEGDSDALSEATRLRLRATLVLDGEEENADEIAAALEQLTSEEADVVREKGIALTYLALSRGNLQQAMDHASRIVAHGDSADEAARARAMAARAVGNVEQALAAAQVAVDLSSDSPRHVALFAELTARSGDTAASLARLQQLPEAARNAAARIAQARIMDQAGQDRDAISQVAQSVLDDAAATNHERAWARLLLARAAASAGDRILARTNLEQAQEGAPPGDELFTLSMIEGALRVGASSIAERNVERLPTPLSIDAGRRAQLSAELALAAHDLTAADAALRHAPDGPRTALARARVLEGRGEFDQARTQYVQAAQGAGLSVPATVHLASMELSLGNAQEAATRIAPLLQAQPNHPDVVPVAVEAQLGLDHAQQAMELVGPALALHPEDVRLLAAKAHVQMALSQWEEALSTIDGALRIESEDADLHADRGRAAQHLERMEVAREAFDAALALVPSHPAALVGRLSLDIAESHVADARRLMDRIDEAQITNVEVERLRARLFVMELAGHAGVRAVRRALDRHRNDDVLLMNLGWLYMQSEEYTDAVRTFSRISGEPSPVEARLARALAQVRLRASNPAKVALEEIRADSDLDSLAPEIRAAIHSLAARIAWNDHERVAAQREVRSALELDPHNSEAHLVAGDMRADRDQDPTEEYTASLEGTHPSSRGLAHLALRDEEVTDASCEFARRYHDAAPNGAYARGIWRVMRDCRHRGER